MLFGKTLRWMEKITIVLAAIVIVIAAMSALRIWQTEWMTYFLRTKNYLDLVIVFAVVWVIAFVLMKLVQWEFRMEVRRR